MALGDSITQATCWRAMVQDQLQEAGILDQVDFVGSMTDNYASCSRESGTLDTGHEGHSGFEATEIATQYIKEWAKVKPDIVNIHLGTS